MSEPSFHLADLGDRRVLTVDGRAHETRYSARVVRLLVERKGARRAPLYFPFKEERARLFLDPLLRYLRGRGARDLSVLEVGASFGHMTEYLAEQPEIAEIHCFDTDPAFVDIVRAKVEEQGLRTGQGGAALRQRRDAAAAVARRPLRSRPGRRGGGAPAAAQPPRPGGRVLPGAGARRPHRHPRHAQPPLPARDALDRPAARAVAAAAAGLRLRAPGPPAEVRRGQLRELRRRRHRVAERHAGRLPALRGPERAR